MSNQSTNAAPPCRLIHELIEEQVRRAPQITAVVGDQGAITYGELDARANRLAHYLRLRGVTCHTPVGLYVDRSLEMVVGLLGILKAGGAYIPLDPAYSSQRLEFVLRDTAAPLVLTQQRHSGTLQEIAADTLCLDTGWSEIAGASSEKPQIEADPCNLAYVLYTSGSTGTPKGVMIEHRSLVSYIADAIRTFGIAVGDRVLQFASISFDTSAEELFTALVSGATLVLRNDAMLGSAARFLHECEAHGISILDLPTAYWHMIVSELKCGQARFPRTLRLAIVGGEAMQREQWVAWRDAVGQRVRLINTYGPTEATIVSALCDLTELDPNSSAPPIGLPVPGAELYVVDEQLRPVPSGVIGELCIGGVGLARGYLNHPELTAQAFIAHSSGDLRGARLYRTGDLARQREDGLLEFIGRRDNQVKMRGFRIELEEVAVVMREHPAVRDAVAIVREDVPGAQRLVGYAVAESGAALECDALHRFLKARLPEYMLPASLAVLDELPLTVNGKIDRRALPAPDVTGAAAQQPSHRTQMHGMQASIWAQILGLEFVGINDNFFALGGHSLLATRIISRMNELFQVDLSLQDLFTAPTVVGLAAVIDACQEPARYLPIEADELEDPAALLTRISMLSDDIVATLLARLLAE